MIQLKPKLVLLVLGLLPLVTKAQNEKLDYHKIHVQKSADTIHIDGMANEAAWEQQLWYPINQLWLGEAYSETDFKGRYKLLWREDALYLLAEITDDVLLDQYADPLKNWWDDDCLEIFIDDNNSGGNHQFNHSAFAYHVALDGNVVDMSPSKEGQLYNSHVTSKRVTEGSTSLWEVKIYVYNDSYTDHTNQKPEKLWAGKTMGFALAYCDNDSSEHRENFIGSLAHPEFKNNQGWINASIFGTLLLRD